MNRLFRCVVALLAIAAAAAGATGEKEATTPPPPLMVYTYDAFGETIQKAIEDHFRTAGVEVRFSRFDDTGGLYNRLYLERDNPQADVAIGLDNTYIARSYRDELFQPYKPVGLDAVDAKLIVDPGFRLVPFDYGGVCLNVDTKALPNPPTTWDELLDPSLKRKIIIMSPATSSPGRNFLLLTIAVFGEDKYLDFWKKLKPNILTVAPGWSEGYGLYTQGEAPIVLSYDTSPAYHIQFENDTRYQTLILGDTAYAQVEVAGILRGTRNLANAQKLIDFLLSPELQELIPLNQVMYPVNSSVTLPEAFRSVKRAGNLVSLDEQKVGKDFDRWLKDWESIMQ